MQRLQRNNTLLVSLSASSISFCSHTQVRTSIFVNKEPGISIVSNILAQPIEYLKGVGPQRADLLKKELGIFTYSDLLHFFPYRHIDKTKIIKIADLDPSVEYAQVQGKLWYSVTVGEKKQPPADCISDG